MLCLKPFIPDIKTWREALFAGHFGPIGVGAIFASILARAELETDSTQPLHDIPDDLEDHDIVTLIWPITTFLVITSIIIHGSSIAVFTLGKRINTLTITMSYTTADEEGPSWMNRLPRIQSQSRSSMSLRKTSLDVEGEVPPGSLPPIGVPYNMLRRQKDEESEPTDRPSARNIKRRRKRRSEGGPITQSAIAPVRAHETERDTSPVGDEEENLEKRASKSDEDDSTSHINTYREGRQILFEDEEGNVVGRTSVDEEKPEEEADYQIEDEKSSDDRHKKLSDASTAQGPGSSEETQVPPAEVKHDEGQAAEHPSTYQNLRNHFMQWGSNAFGKGKHQELHDQKRRRATEHKGPARAYQFGNTVIVEDEDGEVIKKYDIPTIPKKPGKPEEEDGGTKPPKENKAAAGGKKVVHALGRAGTWVGLKDSKGGEAQAGGKGAGEEDDNKLRFRVNHPALAGDGDGGRRMTKEDFIRQISQLDPKTRREVLNEDETPKSLVDAFFKKKNEQAASSPLARMDSPEKEDDDTPHTNIRETLKRHRGSGTAAEARRQRLSAAISPQAQSEDEEDNDDDEEAGPIPAARLHRMTGHAPLVGSSSREERPADDNEEETETPAERKRRLAALGKNSDNEQTEEELQSVDEGDETTDEEDEKEDDEAGPSTLDRIRARRGRGAVGRNLEREEDSDSEDNGEPRPVRGKVQFADGYQPRASRGPNAGAAPRTSRSGSPASPRSTSQQPHRPTISWGGERGRNQ
ncbi:hypothetical protein KEM55_004079 [Ascosphaera atra]|nr:hypothetical protein KEM55_004079 [Ascosphaera atra]